MTPGVAGFLWLLLVGLSLFVGPPVRADVGPWVVGLLSGSGTGVDPLVVAHFNLMGLWPFVFAVLLVDELRSDGVPAWPFVLASMALGAFVLLPWFLLRRSVPVDRGRLERLLVHPVFLAALGATAAGWAVWGLARGSVYTWELARASEGFMYTMTLDFGVLWLVSLLVAREQGEVMGDVRWRFAGLPLVGVLVWVWLREQAS